MNTFTLKAKLSSYRVQLGMDFLLYHCSTTSCPGCRVTEPLIKEAGEKKKKRKLIKLLFLFETFEEEH